MPNTLRTKWLLVVLALCASAAAVADERVLSAIIINRQDVFSDEQVRNRLIYRAANSVHYTTREQTILHEMQLKPGDRIDDETVAQIERLLRNLGIFARVNVRLVQQQGQWQLHIDTGDQLTLIASASGSFLGGVGEVGFTLGERNLLGTGDSLTISYSGNTSDETLGAVSYRDLHLAGGELRSQYQFGRTDEGHFGGVLISKPLKRLTQRHSWSLQANNELRDVDYYSNAVSVVQVPEEKSLLDYRSMWRQGPLRRQWRRGFRVSTIQTEYQSAQGVEAAGIVVPADNRVLFGGLTVALDRQQGYRKVSRLDTLGYVQDIRLASSVAVTAGLNMRQNIDAGSRLEPQLQFDASRALAFGEHLFVVAKLSASASAVPDSDDSWSSALALHAFEISRAAHTFALRCDLRVADNGDRLPAQFTLGESNGLRGYAARQFNGRRRVRLNLEDRIGTSWRLGPFNIGALAFLDAGWIAGQGESLALAGSSLGLGLRLGSSPLLGGALIRMDVALPLNSIEGERTPQVSLALGQVFGFRP